MRPHKHLSKSESFHVIEGEGDVVLFTEDGDIQRVVRLGASGSGRDFYYRLSAGVYHTVAVRTELMVIHEVTNGPFRAEDTLYAPFAPSESDAGLVSQYVQRLLKSMDLHLQQNYEGS